MILNSSLDSTAAIPTGKADGQLVLGVLELVKEEDAKIMQPKGGT